MRRWRQPPPRDPKGDRPGGPEPDWPSGTRGLTEVNCPSGRRGVSPRLPDDNGATPAGARNACRGQHRQGGQTGARTGRAGGAGVGPGSRATARGPRPDVRQADGVYAGGDTRGVDRRPFCLMRLRASRNTLAGWATCLPISRPGWAGARSRGEAVTWRHAMPGGSQLSHSPATIRRCCPGDAH
jgi:hypothetical protein